MEPIANRLRRARRIAGLTQRELAERAGVTQKSISSWERAQRIPRPRMLQKIAEALDIEPGSLVAHAQASSALPTEQTDALLTLCASVGFEEAYSRLRQPTQKSYETTANALKAAASELRRFLALIRKSQQTHLANVGMPYDLGGIMGKASVDEFRKEMAEHCQHMQTRIQDLETAAAAVVEMGVGLSGQGAPR